MTWQDIIKENEANDPAFDERNQKRMLEMSRQLQEIREELLYLGHNDLSEYRELLFDARDSVDNAHNIVAGILEDELLAGSTELAETLARRRLPRVKARKVE